jgi:carboxymethylenebutenolidase
VKTTVSVPLLLLAFFVPFSASSLQDTQVKDRKPPAENDQVQSTVNGPEPEVVTFAGPEQMSLHGFLYVPPGKGPFPAMIWNHGSEAKPGSRPELGEFYASNGFVFFVPHRHGHGRSADAGPYHMDLQRDCKSQDCVIHLHELYNKDVVAAVEWLKQQPFVDGQKIAMSGVSFGGIQTLLTAEKGAGIRGFVAFAPAAMSWNSFPDLRARLLRAEEQAQRPIFLIQAEGDYNTGPYEMLGTYLLKKGGLNKAKLYAKFGSTNQEAHGAFATKVPGISIWQADVLSFLRTALK